MKCEEQTKKPDPANEQKNGCRRIIPILRTAICLLAAVALILIKQLGGELYDSVREYIDGLKDNSAVVNIETDNEELIGAAADDYKDR